MRRLLLLFCAVLMLAAPSLAQDDGGYPEPSYPEPAYPEPSYPDPAPPAGPGYGTVTFYNQTALDIEFSVDGVYACLGYANSSCSSQVSPGRHYLSGRSRGDNPQEAGEYVDVGDGGEVSWTLSGGGTPDSGSGGTPQEPQLTGYGMLEFKNYTALDIDFSIDGVYACRAYQSSTCSAQASVGTHYVSARTVEATPQESSSSGVEVVEGGTTSIEYSGGGTTPTTGYGTIEIKNGTALQLDAYIDGAYACRAEASSSCTAQASVGRHTVTVRTATGETQESSADGVEVYDGTTTPVEFSGGGAAPTGYGAIRFDNGTALEVAFMIDGTFACRANPHDTCTAQASVGPHTVTATTTGPNPQEMAPQTLEVVDGGTTAFGITGGGAPAAPEGPALPTPPPAFPPPPPATNIGTVIFENQSMYLVTFDIDGLPACRAIAHSTCSANTAEGRHAITARTLSDPPYKLDAVIDVTAGMVTRYAVGNAANARPSP
jgi:hypothetical protein